MIDVLVVGAGPAGSAAALRLARAGHEVLLVDRCRFPRPKACGEYYNPQCVRLLDELGVLPALYSRGVRTLDNLVVAGSVGAPLSMPVDRIAPGGTALSLGREWLDLELVRAAERAGATFREGVTVRAPLREGERVTGAVVRIDGEERVVRARLVLAADGLRSRFARELGLGRGDGGRRRFGLTGRYHAVPGAGNRVEMIAGNPGCCGLAVRGSEANVGLVVDGNRAREIGGDPARFFRMAVAAFPRLLSDLDGEATHVRTVGPLTWRTSRQSTAGCLLLGDAAGFYDPFTGEGVTFALQSAEFAASVAHAALTDDDLSSARLAEYDRLRRAAIGPRVQLQRVIQAVTERPPVLEYVLRRLRRHEDAAQTLLGILSGGLSPTRALSPSFLARLLL